MTDETIEYADMVYRHCRGLEFKFKHLNALLEKPFDIEIKRQIDEHLKGLIVASALTLNQLKRQKEGPQYPHWSEYLRGSGCLCGHFESCEWCSNIDWSSDQRNPITLQDYIDYDYVMAESPATHTRWFCQRKWAHQHGWMTMELKDVIAGRPYSE